MQYSSVFIGFYEQWLFLIQQLRIFPAGTFDVVIVNLYPFYDTVSSTNEISFEDGIENIDIGGPAMIRAAAKVVYLRKTSFFVVLLFM